VAGTHHFDDVLAANERYARSFAHTGLRAQAARGLAVLTCIDSRIEPLQMLGLRPGDAKIIRNAGARVTDDVVPTLVVAAHLLGVERLMVIAHTDCRMAGGTEADMREAIAARGGPDTSGLAFCVVEDQLGALRADVDRVRVSPYLKDIRVGGFLYDVGNGKLTQLC